MSFDELVNFMEQFAGEFGMEDTSMDPSVALEVAKFLDPTGILSWNDVKEAANAFDKDPSPSNALLYMLAIGSVIPVMGKATKPFQIAARSMDATKMERPVRNFVEEFYRDIQTGEVRKRIVEKGLDPRQVQNASNIVRSNPSAAISSDWFRVGDSFVKRPQKATRSFQGGIVSRNYYPNARSGSDAQYQLEKRWDKIADSLRMKTSGIDFNPQRIQLIDRQNYHGRDIIEVKLPPEAGGQRIIMYQSSKGTSGKTAGYWYPILGWTDDWFIKSRKGTDLTEFSSPYFVQFAEFLAKNGPDALP